MKSDELLDAIGEARDEYVYDVRNSKNQKVSSWIKRLAVAACFCLILAGGIDTLDRFEYNFKAGCSAYPGEFANGAYYYQVDHSGVWSYTPGDGSQKELSTYWYEEWSVNDYGIYYWQDLGLYVRPHATGERQKLYAANPFDSTHIRFELQADGNVILTVYNKYTEIVYELLLDGLTGEVIETVMERTSYSAGHQYYSDRTMAIGEREFELVKTGDEYSRYTLTENGEQVLPEGITIVLYSEKYFDGALWLKVWSDQSYDRTEDEYVILYASGETEIITLPNKNYYGGVGRYVFYVDYDEYNGVLCCTDIDTGEMWPLEADAPYEVHDFATDGTYIYTMVPWDEDQVCWRLEFDESGKPVSMSLIDADIAQE